MNCVIGIEAEQVLLEWGISPARYMRNDVQFGELSSEMEGMSFYQRWWTSMDGDPISHHYSFTASFRRSCLTLYCKDFMFKVILCQKTVLLNYQRFTGCRFSNVNIVLLLLVLYECELIYFIDQINMKIKR